MNEGYLLLGTNVGDRKANLASAQAMIEQEAGKVIRASAIYETAPWGNEDQPAFLNRVLLVRSEAGARELLNILLGIEKKMGRARKEKWEERIIDIDILFFNEEVIQEDGLIVPHPFMHQRRFTLVPLSEIAGTFVHPVYRKTVNELLSICPDVLDVKKTE